MSSVRRAYVGVLLLAISAVPAQMAPAATIRVISSDGPGEGLNDPTPATPVGGNAGRTLGEQRRIALEYAAQAWARVVASPVEIRISAAFDPLPCNASSTTLGLAGPVSVFRDFAGATLPNTYYAAALADRLAGSDLAPDEDDIAANFNSAFGTTCAFPAGWYYGLDGRPTGDDSDFVTVALHELAHGLGFVTFVEPQNGALFDDANDPFMYFLLDTRTGKTFDQMNDAERRSAAKAARALRWNGPAVLAASGDRSDGVDALGRVEMYAPAFVQAGSSLNHWSDEIDPLELLGPFFEAPIHALGLAVPALVDMGWELEAGGACAADCDGGGGVTIEELIAVVRIALGDASPSQCLAADADGDGIVEVDEVIRAVANALEGCTAH
ncbi:MAG: hypothetical protein AB7V27_02315 [Candidatus Binatia bacterium]